MSYLEVEEKGPPPSLTSRSRYYDKVSNSVGLLDTNINGKAYNF